MRRSKFSMTATTAALALAAFLGVGSVLAADDQKPGKDGKEIKERHRVVILDKDGKRQVIEGDAVNIMRRGYLGVSLTELTPELREHFGVNGEAGVLVAKVESGSPAEKAGIKVGDIITSVDGKDVKASWDVRFHLRGIEGEQTVPIEISRNGRAQTVNATVTLRDRPEIDLAPFFGRGENGEPFVLKLDERGRLLGEPGRMGEPMPGGPNVRFFNIQREADLEKRIKELEKRINDLERQLEKR